MLLMMEEISWGQRIFQWSTPNIMMKINSQGETNIHNIFDPHLSMLYPAFNLSLGVLLLTPTSVKSRIASRATFETFMHLIPNREFSRYGIVFLILSILGAYFREELTEEVFSIFGVALAAHQLSISRQRNEPRISNVGRNEVAQHIAGTAQMRQTR